MAGIGKGWVAFQIVQLVLFLGFGVFLFVRVWTATEWCRRLRRGC